NFGPAYLLNPCVGGSFGQAEEYTVHVGTLSASEFIKENLGYYPNPVQDILNLDASTKVKSITVYDISGRLIMTKNLNSAKSQVNMSVLTPGVYIVKAELESGSKSFKMIKK